MMDYFKEYMTVRLKSFQEEETRKWVRISTTFWSEEENIDSLKIFDQERYDNYRYDIEQMLIKGIEQKEFSNGLDLDSTIYQIKSAIDGVSVLSCLMNKIITDEQIESTVNMYANYLKGD